MAQSTERRYLEKARKLIADPRNWTKGAAARYRDNCVSYCSLGAVYAAAGLIDDKGVWTVNSEKWQLSKDANDPIARTITVLAKTVSPLHTEACLKGEGMAAVVGSPIKGVECIVAEFNDNSTHRIVLKAFDQALKNV